jgi:hypothetical protein
MKKALEFAETLANEYSDLLDGKTLQKVFKDHPTDSYQSSYAGGTIKLKAMGAIAPAFAIRELIIGTRSGHNADYWGACEPKFKLRPLWIGCDTDVPIGDCAIGVPHYLIENSENVETFCQRLIELGYNAVVFGKKGTDLKKAHADIHALFRLLRNYGVKTIIRIEDKVPDIECDYIFCESQKDRVRSKETEVERKLGEVKKLESLGKPVIYFLNAEGVDDAQRQKQWMSELCDEVGPKTILAFPGMVDGRLHPYWNTLREMPDASSTPLLPIVNIGNVGFGEGLWPSLNIHVLKKVFSQMRRHEFAGIIGIVNQLPKREGLLDCTLWAASQFLWRGEVLERSVESWFLANKWEYTLDFERVDRLVSDLQELRIKDELSADEAKASVESFVAQLKEIQVKLGIEERKKLKKDDLSFYDYFIYFERDARRLIVQFLQKHHVALASVLGNDDPGEGFWTLPPKAGKVDLLAEPNKGNGVMSKIYYDNRLF